MRETLNIDTEDVYEAPMLAEAGHFGDLTQGDFFGPPEAGVNRLNGQPE